MASGLVKVQDAVIKDAGYKVSAEDVIEMEGQRICGQQYQYLLFHKPAGIVSATEDTREETVLDAVRRGGFAGKGSAVLAKDLFPMGRLDKDTEGLLILTNDGELAHRLFVPEVPCRKDISGAIGYSSEWRRCAAHERRAGHRREAADEARQDGNSFRTRMPSYDHGRKISSGEADVS